MTSQERLQHLTKLRLEYYEEGMPFSRKVEILRQVRDWAEEESNYRCVVCKKTVIDVPDERPVIEGHIYSQSGVDEFRISNTCEWCFDKFFLEDDDPRRAEWFPETVQE